METPRCGSAAIVGRSNVGKSTLLNALIEQKISITSRKQQTTRTPIRGIRTGADYQIAFVDTPGWQQQPRGRLNQTMNREVRRSLEYVDVVLFMFDATGWNELDDDALRVVHSLQVPLVAVANKIDLVKHKNQLLPLLEQVNAKAKFETILPISARNNHYIEEVVRCIARMMPPRAMQYPGEQVTDRSERFLVAEIIREKVFRFLADELPYRTSVMIDRFADSAGLVEIDATICVARDSQKGIVIGSGGSMIKRIGVDARRDIEQLLQRKVLLRTWVKVDPRWSAGTDPRESLGSE